MKRFKR